MAVEAPKKLSDCLPSPFSGSEINKDLCESHILKFKDYVEYQNLKDFGEIYSRFKLTLEGRARLWIEDERFENFDELTSGFVKKFSPPRTTYELVKEYAYLCYTEGTNFEHYVEKLQKLGKELKYSNEQIAHKFMLSLPKECQKFIVVTNPNGSLKEWTVAAKSYLNLEDTPCPKELNFAINTSASCPPDPSSTDIRSEMSDVSVRELQEGIFYLKEKCRSLEHAENSNGDFRSAAEDVRAKLCGSYNRNKTWNNNGNNISKGNFRDGDSGPAFGANSKGESRNYNSARFNVQGEGRNFKSAPIPPKKDISDLFSIMRANER